MKTLATVLAIGAALCAFIGFGYLTGATKGVGIICFGAVIGVLARICQAEANSYDIKKSIDNISHKLNSVNQ